MIAACSTGLFMGLLVLPFALAGCSRKGPGRSQSASPTVKEDKGILSISSERSTYRHRSEKGALLMEIDSDSSETSLSRSRSNELVSRLKAVRGRLYRDGQVACTFTAPEGIFDKQAKVLRLDKGVKVVSAERQVRLPGDAKPQSERITLTAQSLVWTEKTNLIVASGTVWIKGSSFEAGPSPILAATRDLSRFGTPDRVKPDSAKP